MLKEKGMQSMKRRTARSLCAVGLSLALMAGMVPAAMAAEPAETADSIYINGNIYTVDDDFTTATAMAVKGTASSTWATRRGRRPIWAPAPK